MRYTAVFLLALVCLNAVQSVSLRKNTEGAKTNFALERLRFLGKKSQVASQVVNAIELHLSSGGAVQDVIDIVQQALDDVEARRSALVSEFHDRQATLQGIIDQTNTDLSANQVSLAAVNQEIYNLEQSVQHWEGHIEDLHNEIESLAARHGQIETARDADEAAYAARKQRDENSLAVLQVIIQKLTALQARGPVFLQVSKKEIEKALGRIPKSNPIQALIQLSTKFDVETLNNVISKLSDIQNAIQASYAEDRDAEVASAAHYAALIAEVEQLSAEAQADLNSSEESLATANASLVSAKSRRDDLTSLIQSEVELINNTQSELDAAVISYNHRIDEANQAVEAIKIALDYLKNNQAGLEQVNGASDQIEDYVHNE